MMTPEKAFSNAHIKSAMWDMRGKDALVLRLCFKLLKQGEHHDYIEICGMVGASRESVRQLRTKGLRKLAAKIAERHLTEWLEQRLTEMGNAKPKRRP